MGEKQFKLPDVGEGVAEGELVSWQVEVGDTVTEDQVVAEVETDKALVEVPSPYNGTVKELHAEEGEMVPVGDVIVTYEVHEEGEAVDTTPAESEAEDEATDEVESTDTEAVPDEEAAADAAEAEAEAEPGAAEAETEPAQVEAETPAGRVFAPPSARRLARELGVDIAAVEGSGPGGRVSDADVRAHAEGGTSAEPEAAASGAAAEAEATGETAAAETAPEPADEAGAGAGAQTVASTQAAASRDRTLAVPATRRLAEELGVDVDAVPTDEARDGEAFVTAEQVREFAERGAEPAAAGEAGTEAAEPAGEAGTAGEAGEPARVETIPFRGVRRTIAEQMAASKYTAPHVTHHDTVVVDELVETRAELKAVADEKGTRLTYMAFVLKAIVAGLKEYPILNSELDEENEQILLKNYYDIGIAVATDTGLMVPVVRDVDRKGLLELADEVNDLASRARERKVTREEMQGGTFTITNFGAIGGEYATPIINVPETAIMGLGAIEQRPVVEDSEARSASETSGAAASGEVRAAHTLPLSLTIDHRVIDGAEAAAFTNTVMDHLRTPTKLLL